MTLELEQAIRNHAFVQGLSRSQVSALGRLARLVDFEGQEEILLEGQRSSAFYLVISGSVAVELRTPAFGICVQALTAGQVFGWSAVLDRQDTLFQVRAREQTRAIRIEGAGLKALLRDDPALGVELLQRTLQVVAGRVKATEQRFAEMCGVRV